MRACVPVCELAHECGMGKRNLTGGDVFRCLSPPVSQVPRASQQLHACMTWQHTEGGREGQGREEGGRQGEKARGLKGGREGLHLDCLDGVVQLNLVCTVFGLYTSLWAEG